MPDTIQKPRPVMPSPSPGGEGDGPKAPNITKPNTEELLKRMRKVDRSKWLEGLRRYERHPRAWPRSIGQPTWEQVPRKPKAGQGCGLVSKAR